MSPSRVLVVYKRDAYEHYVRRFPDAHMKQLLRKSHPDILDLKRAYAVHKAALKTVIGILRSFPVKVTVKERTGLRAARRFKLVVSVGGDGTFLHACHAIKDTPILGVNSDPLRSEAAFSAATAQNFARLCRLALAGKLRELHLFRLCLSLNGQLLPERAVNDVLVAHDNPATMSRYRLQIGRHIEVQKSSGLWVATAAGSGSALLAAGGMRQTWSSRRFQYRPRELYQGRLSRYRLTGGILSQRSRVRVHWMMRKGSAFLDGPHVRIPLRFADELEIRPCRSDPVRVLGIK